MVKIPARSRTHILKPICGLVIAMAAILSVGGAMAAQSYVESIKPYNAALAAMCPQKHLDRLTAGDFNQIIEDYLGKLSSTEQSRWEQAAQPICAKSFAGLSCANIAFVRAATKLGKIHQLAGAACHSGYVCRAQSQCRQKQR